MASAGFSRRHRRLTLNVLGGLTALTVSCPASARRIVIGATTLDAALTSLSQQSGVDIASVETGLRGTATRPLSGNMSTKSALLQLLADTGYRAVAVRGGYRVVRARQDVSRRVLRQAVRTAMTSESGGDIVVTASKQAIPLLRFPGSIAVVGKFEATRLAARPTALDELTHSLPVLQSTALGPGRNKVFVRGIADSSFNGPSQATLATYFGDVPLGFSGPDPGVQLIDIERVEILEGPQGTLYGAGAIGGVIRVAPQTPALDRHAASLAVGGTATEHGALSYDANGVVNLPIVTDRLGLRAVGYYSRSGGYIDDTDRTAIDINRVTTSGARLAGRYSADGWTIDLSAIGQRIAAADGQYDVRVTRALRRRTAIAEPFGSSILLGRLVIDKQWDSGLHLVSATGAAQLDSFDRFDATALVASATPTAYQTDTAEQLVTHETRLSRTTANGTSWVVGVAALYDRDAQSRTLGVAADPIDITGVTNSTQTIAAFGEGTVPLTSRLALTTGARVTYARIDGRPSVVPRSTAFIRGDSTFHIDPTIALSWHLGADVAAFARFQSGYRTGGIAVARGVGRVADFKSDSILVGELGVRKSGGNGAPFSGSASVSFAQWRNIQADLFSRRGQPYTSNIGDADIVALEAMAAWTPVHGLSADVAILYTYNRVFGPLADLSTRANRRLPETPPLAASATLSYSWDTRPGPRYAIDVTGRYVGRSVLGTGDFLDVSQGDYATFGLSARASRGKITTTLSVENLTDARANVFALGNPLTLAARNQSTPLRPRNVRLGFAIAY